MVYQEDVIKVAHYFAGLSLSEADILRRGMSGKYRSRSEFLAVKEKFFSNCKKRKHEKLECGGAAGSFKFDLSQPPPPAAPDFCDFCIFGFFLNPQIHEKSPRF